MTATKATATGATTRGQANNTEEVYGRVREAILDGRIAPGEILSQVKLAATMGVSTTPLREALRLLQAEGLIEAEPNRRCRVTSLDPADIDAVYGTRIVTEALAIRLTVPMFTSVEIDGLRADLAAMSATQGGEDLSQWAAIHTDFHRKLVRGCGEPMLRIIESVSARAERYRRSSAYASPPRVWEIGNQEHHAIVDACADGDATRAAVELARHFARSALQLLAKFAPEANPVAIRTALQSVQGTTDA